MNKLYQALRSYEREDIYPFHMPGHKRNKEIMENWFPAGMDITEVTGFDNLHHPEDIILEAMENAAALYKVKKTFLGVNGSTGMILSAISACVKKGGKLLMARNSHRSAYHAVYLRDIIPVYVYPQLTAQNEINGSVSPEEVEKILSEDPEISAVYITSPTYDGVVSDIRGIAEAAHRRNLPLIVDEAHGAHLTFSEYFPESAVQCGADIVIHSVHKTLMSLTQTSLMHVCTDRTDCETLQKFLTIYQSSSPSYILMGSIDACMDRIGEEGKDLFRQYTELLEETRSRLRRLKKFRLIEPDKEYPDAVWGYDPSKILISARGTGFSGQELFSLLREKYRLELEMSAPSYILALSAVGDRKEGMDRLVKALEETEESLLSGKSGGEGTGSGSGTGGTMLLHQEQVLTVTEAMEGKTAAVPLMESEGRISAEYLCLYPPGIPLITPGEKISGQLLENVGKYLQQGLTITGLKDKHNKIIQVVEGRL